MRKDHAVTTAQILDRMKDSVAPLPSQREYMKNLATILAMHINRNLLIDDGHAPDDLPAPSAIIVAPTGQGKTYLLRKMTKVLDLNLITVDCSTLVGESFKGVSLSQRIAGAMEEAKDERAFSRSVLFFDEVDKLCKTGTSNSTGMTSILQLYNGGSVAISKDDRTAKSIDVSRFTILMGGAFSGLEDIIRQRICPKAKIGFGASGMEEKTDAECHGNSSALFSAGSTASKTRSPFSYRMQHSFPSLSRIILQTCRFSSTSATADRIRSFTKGNTALAPEEDSILFSARHWVPVSVISN